MNVLFMCVANSARSQLAEGLAKKIWGRQVRVESAGSHPAVVNPFAIRALQEIGIDISDHHSKSVADLDAVFLRDLDYVITLCAEEVCPVLLSSAKRLHWPFPDPGGASVSEQAGLENFRRTRDAIAAKIRDLSSELRLLPAE